MDTDTSQVVYTNRARCRDCYRCLRACPVKAIKMQHGQAYVVKEQCMACGTCIRECPQKAKSFRNDLARARFLTSSGSMVAVSVAPSFASLFNEWEIKRFPSALRQLGFKYVAETAVGAQWVAGKTSQIVKGDDSHAHICTACPVVVTYIERYEPDMLPALVPVVSPMVAHARHLKEKLGQEAGVVFVGPCVGKKAEAERSEFTSDVDCVLTFSELFEWMEQAGVNISLCEESDFDEQPEGDARFFPLPGGLSKTAAMSTDMLDLENLSASGFEAIKDALEDIRAGRQTFLEPLFCANGCVNGPGMPREYNVYARRAELLHYAKGHPGEPVSESPRVKGLDTGFVRLQRQLLMEFSEGEIGLILEQTGKSNPEDQLNCGACGYPTCRDKAIAVLRGMAEPEMCIPYMRRLAERRTDRIIETSPNGIVILDDRLCILSMNPAFKRFFLCSDAVLGKHISYLMDPAPFERLALSGEKLVELTVSHDNYKLLCHELLYPLRDEHQYAGIFVNITRSDDSERRLEKLRADTVTQAQELLDHQVAMAQKMAQFLGESAAHGEDLVRKLLSLAEEKAKDGRGPTAPF